MYDERVCFSDPFGYLNVVFRKALLRAGVFIRTTSFLHARQMLFQQFQQFQLITFAHSFLSGVRIVKFTCCVISES